jgi:UDP-N-acetylmuramate--alanine ligase
MDGISYGFDPKSDLVISNFRQQAWHIEFDIHFNGKKYSQIQLQLTGKHNALNGAAVFGLALQLGISEDSIRRTFMNFEGVGRRCEKKWEVDDILFLDDYAHHPTEIKATLQAIRNAVNKRRIICVYQPHRYSRIAYCLGLFGSVFDLADELIITDLYTAGETPIPGVSHEKVIEEVIQKGKSCHYIPRLDVAEFLLKKMEPSDVIVSLGAGDITRLAQEMISYFPSKVP